MRHLHILGICGTFMAGVAVLAKALGYTVTGSDEKVYPPMSDSLRDAGIQFFEGYDAAHLSPAPDEIIVGNAISRGNPEFEAVLNQQLSYTSGPAWLASAVLGKRRVLAVAGTHGKTTVTALLVWCLRALGCDPGYLIGGVAKGIQGSAHLGEDFFVIEGDEYDSALFDKRSKFIHYHPQYLILNNLEFDHADIFRDIEDIKRQFHHLLKTIPSQGHVYVNAKDQVLAAVLAAGFWSKAIYFNADKAWHAKLLTPDGAQFTVFYQDKKYIEVSSPLIGEHNVSNTLAAIALLHDLGFPREKIAAAIHSFPGVKRRLEKISEKNGVTIYDDFAHHPTAIRATLDALRARVGKARIIAVLQFASYTMRQGVHTPQVFVDALRQADTVVIRYSPGNEKNIVALKQHFAAQFYCFNKTQEIAAYIQSQTRSGDHVLIMSNGSFDGLYACL